MILGDLVAGIYMGAIFEADIRRLGALIYSGYSGVPREIKQPILCAYLPILLAIFQQNKLPHDRVIFYDLELVLRN